MPAATRTAGRVAQRGERLVLQGLQEGNECLALAGFLVRQCDRAKLQSTVVKYVRR